MQMPGNKNTSQTTQHEQKVMLRDHRISKKESHQGESSAIPAPTIAGEVTLY